ncbi:MAG: SEA (Seh1-associated) complex subunit [Watsoniomyces obsoletus]|nr:MAG: SEA (Seh1-associated) complex subunit [Watsoniomyces obsoletus]
MSSQLLEITHFAYPAILLVVFLAAVVGHSILTASQHPTLTTSKTLRGPDGKPLPAHAEPSPAGPVTVRPDFTPLQRALVNALLLTIIATFLADAVNIIVHALSERPWWCGQASAVYVISSVFVYALLLISILDTRPSPTIVHLVTWLTGLSLETILFALSVVPFRGPNHAPDGWQITSIVIQVIRVVALVGLILSYLVVKEVLRQKDRKHRTDEEEEEEGEEAEAHERTGLLNGSHDGSTNANGRKANGHANPQYGTTEQTVHDGPATPPRWSRPTTTPSKSWWEYIKGYSLFFPYLWPSNSRRLQIVFVACILIMVLQRGVNLLVPYQVGVVTDILSGADDEDDTEGHGSPRIPVPWMYICVFALYKLLQGGSGLLGALRSYLWIPIGQYSYQALSTSAFEHVHGLSLDFHLGKKTGEVLSALSKGNSINTFLEQVTFQVVPMLIDLALAIGYFLIVFDAYYALVVAIVTFCYMYLTIRMAQWRADIRRNMVNASRDEDAVKNDSMVSYETVKYFNAEAYEFERYRNAVRKYQQAEYKVLFSLNIMNVAQNTVFTLGLLITCFIAAYQVTTGQRKVGRFVSLLTYMAQLQGPLNFFGTFYRSIQSAMINSERMLELFKEQPTVVDDPDVKPLTGCDGEIVFQDVEFSYDPRKPALTGLSFRAPPGSVTALVGESGGGKSTVFRLLFRFYNANSGRILVDGHDVRSVTIDSVRRHIGIVPQDTVLFNETLMYNLKYANPDATDEMVFEACRAASIHERILSFPDGYSTKVGERGLRLSGGEKQRVAIARTILKDPRIILLDEATAALDSETEQHIQGALERLSHGRTMLVIAHRLSTITNADQILCLHAGRVIESGTHHELLKLKGRYASMWKKQIRAERAAEEARVLKDKAEKLRRESTSAGVVEEGESSGKGNIEEEEDVSGNTTENEGLVVKAASRDTGDDDGGEGNSDSHAPVVAAS